MRQGTSVEQTRGTGYGTRAFQKARGREATGTQMVAGLHSAENADSNAGKGGGTRASAEVPHGWGARGLLPGALEGSLEGGRSRSPHAAAPACGDEMPHAIEGGMAGGRHEKRWKSVALGRRPRTKEAGRVALDDRKVSECLLGLDGGWTTLIENIVCHGSSVATCMLHCER